MGAWLGSPAAGLRPLTPPPAPEWSPAAAAACGRSLAEAADWTTPCGGGWWGEGWRWETGRGRSHAGTELQMAHLWEEFKMSGSRANTCQSHDSSC